MNLTSSFHVLVLLIVLLTFSPPLIAFGAPDPTQQADPTQRPKPTKQVDTTAQQKPVTPQVVDPVESLQLNRSATGAELIVTPQVVDPVESLKMQAIADAKRDAEASVNSEFWATVGCFIGFLGIFAAETYHPPVPTVPLLGKSAEYTAFYTDTYRAETQKLQSTPATIGCFAGTLISILAIAVYGNHNNLW